MHQHSTISKRHCQKMFGKVVGLGKVSMTKVELSITNCSLINHNMFNFDLVS